MLLPQANACKEMGTVQLIIYLWWQARSNHSQEFSVSQKDSQDIHTVYSTNVMYPKAVHHSFYRETEELITRQNCDIKDNTVMKKASEETWFHVMTQSVEDKSKAISWK